MFKELLKAHEYWSTKGLKIDLVVLNEDESNYMEPLQLMLNDVVSANYGKHILDTPGGVYIRNANQIPSLIKYCYTPLPSL